MRSRNIAALVLTIVSLAILYPGLTLPMLRITVAADLPILGRTTFFEQTQSILETIDTLYSNNNKFVGILILLFSIIIPIAKGVSMMAVLLVKKAAWKLQLYRVVHSIGKWSMADVFVVGIFIAFLSTESNRSVEAELFEGFYYFTAYCLVSLLSIQLVKLD
ncbi:paraquat-inducible protein A [Reichenbachiella ulvae]|uniref:Paraquat-inducible protein A n=1 Tax=Reichenbachiella ulvae TaxID=2980104 RepID=A0ABT3CPG4_9BACT|nr:paraquat-inducible protein A [Reichenbachiella ulvae]MCV9385471.1 paraquat-inducible protein A [Reichenbachiella ulvae]